MTDLVEENRQLRAQLKAACSKLMDVRLKPQELTDEEIYQSAEYYGVNNSGTLDFARAILRKAQEK